MMSFHREMISHNGAWRPGTELVEHEKEEEEEAAEEAMFHNR